MGLVVTKQLLEPLETVFYAILDSRERKNNLGTIADNCIKLELGKRRLVRIFMPSLCSVNQVHVFRINKKIGAKT